VGADVGAVFEVGAQTVSGEAAHDRIEFIARSQIKVRYVGRIVVQDLKSSIIFTVEVLVSNLFAKVGDGRVVDEGVVLWHQKTSRRSNVVTGAVYSLLALISISLPSPSFSRSLLKGPPPLLSSKFLVSSLIAENVL
jgi:hypothetical protein